MRQRGMLPQLDWNNPLTQGVAFYWAAPDWIGPTGFEALDFSGNVNHGTFTNMDPATAWTSTAYGTALDFDGSDDRVVMPSTLGIVGDISVEAWIVSGTASQIKTVVANANTANSDNVWGLYVLGNFGNRPAFKVNGKWSNIASGPAIADGVLVHLVAAHTAGVGVTIYIDGVPTTWSLAHTPAATTQAATIGNENPSGNRNQFKGQILSVGVYDRVMSGQEVALRRSIGPNGLFAPRRRIFGYVPAAGGGARQSSLMLMGLGV